MPELPGHPPEQRAAANPFEQVQAAVDHTRATDDKIAAAAEQARREREGDNGDTGNANA